MAKKDKPILYTLKEVSNILLVSERSVFRYIKSGRLKAKKIGQWRIKKEDLINS